MESCLIWDYLNAGEIRSSSYEGGAIRKRFHEYLRWKNSLKVLQNSICGVQ